MGSIAACLAICASLGVWAVRGSTQGDDGTMKPDVAERIQAQSRGFLFCAIPVDRESARAGEGQQVAMQGHPLTLAGQEIKVGDPLRAATLQDPAMRNVAIADGNGRVRILSVVPSLRTPTCEQQTHYLSERNGGLSERIELVTISLDTPEIQGKFAKEAGIENVTFLSDARATEFGRAHGLLIEEPRILARALLVIDSENVVRCLQVVPEVSHMPDIEAAFASVGTVAAEEPTR